ncbi:SH3 domain-containing protein [Geomonas silvestris]|nr:SH3 domain-containing protein [Geomonas silvestris]
MKGTTRLIGSLMLSVFVLCSCATGRNGELTWSSPQACIASYTTGGAILGATAGVLIALATGGGAKNTATKAGIGAAAGGAMAFAYAWGHCFAAFTKVKSAEDLPYSTVRKEIDYQPRQGTLTKIKELSVDPVAIAPGDKPSLNASYYVMTPEEKEVEITETIILKIFDPYKKKFVELGKSQEKVVVQPGKRKATSEIPIPPNAEEAKFFIAFRVDMDGKYDQKEVPLTITNDGAILAKAKDDLDRKGARVARVEAEHATPKPVELASAVGSKNLSSENVQQVEITAKVANLRVNPDASSKLVAKANRGEKFALQTTITVGGKKWCQVKLEDGASAWVSASLCKITE